MIAYVMMRFACAVFSSSPEEVSMRSPAYIIMMTVMRAMKPFKKTIIFARIPSTPGVSNALFVQLIEMPKMLLPPHLPHP